MGSPAAATLVVQATEVTRAAVLNAITIEKSRLRFMFENPNALTLKTRKQKSAQCELHAKRRLSFMVENTELSGRA